MKPSRSKNTSQESESWTALGMEPNLLKRIDRLSTRHDRSQVAEVRYLVKKEEKEEGIFEDDLS